MAEMVWRPNRSALNQFLTGPSGAGYTAVRRMQDKTAALADMKVPVDTSALKGSQVKTPVVVTGTTVSAGVEYRSPYALFVHEGTKPHVIVPRNKKILYWIPRGGSPIAARKVNHPGTRPQRWLQTALFFAARSEGFRTTDK